MKQPVKDRHPQNAEVEPGSPVRDVVKVILNSLAKGGVAAPTVDLGPASDTGFDAMACHVVGDGLAELLDENWPFRSGTDQAHVALEHVDELRQFIKTSFSEKRPEGSSAWIVLASPHRARVLFSVRSHATKF